MSRAISAATAEQLVLSLADVVDRDAPVMPAVAQWLTTTLADALAAARQARSLDRRRPRTNRSSCRPWPDPATKRACRSSSGKGCDYRLDLAAAEHQRILEVREQLESPGLDAALASGQPQQIAEALLALIYAPALGDPAGPALLGADIITRHDFGLDAPAAARRDTLAWAPPRDHVGDGIAVARRGRVARPRPRPGAAGAAPARRQRDAG